MQIMYGTLCFNITVVETLSDFYPSPKRSIIGSLHMFTAQLS